MINKEYRINKKKDYHNIYKHGKKTHGKYIIVFIKENKFPYNRFGIVTSKKVGNAVTRNRAKRQLRAVIAKNMDKINVHYDIVIVTRYNIKNILFAIIEKDFLFVMRKASLC